MTNTNSNGTSHTLSYTYTLNEDGTFEASFGTASRATGYYTIHDNTLSITRMRDTTGPRDEVTTYYTNDYVIADDCSYFTFDDGGNESFRLNKQS